MSELDREKINLGREQVVEKITKWLKEEGHKVELGRHSKAYYFGTVKMYEKKLDSKGNIEVDEFKFDAIHVNIPMDYRDRIWIENVAGFSSVDKDAFNGLPETTQHNFIFELKLALYQLNVIFDFMDNTSIKISKLIFFDGLSKHILFDTISAVLSANRTSGVKYGQLSDLLLSRGKNTSVNI
jgi:hypothetical protein